MKFADSASNDISSSLQEVELLDSSANMYFPVMKNLEQENINVVALDNNSLQDIRGEHVCFHVGTGHFCFPAFFHYHAPHFPDWMVDPFRHEYRNCYLCSSP
jgi:hypothetical protein